MPNVSPAAQRKVAAVRALLEKFVVVSHSDDFPGVPGIGTNCYVPDPAYDELRELVEDKCAWCAGRGTHTEALGYKACSDCAGTGRIARTWGTSITLSGSLYGAAMERLEADRDDGEMVFEAVYLDIVRTFWQEVRRTHDRDLAIMTALEAALTAQLAATS